jgi:hypothetical protein
MSWGIAGDWLAVAGLALLTFGTGAQAVSNLAEFRYLRGIASEAAVEAVTQISVALMPVGIGPGPVLDLDVARLWPWLWRRLMPRRLRSMLSAAGRKIGALVSYPGKMRYLRDKGGDEAVQLARYLRAAKVWAILMIGSMLALAAAAIQLALA